MPRRRQQGPSIYWKGDRAYADFRAFAPWGGKLEALKPEGSRTATSDPDEALSLYVARRDALKELREQHPKGLASTTDDPLDRIPPFIGYHLSVLRRGRRSGRKLTPGELQSRQKYLAHFAGYLARLRSKQHPHGVHYLREVTRDHVSAWLAEVEAHPPHANTPRPGGRRGKLSGNTLAKYLAAVRGMLKRAWQDGRISENPALKIADEDRPATARASDTPVLEVHEAALVLEAARRLPLRGGAPAENYLRLACYLLTGGRASEVDDLDKSDVDFEREEVHFRPNTSRARLKTAGSVRIVRLWPQLRDILKEYMAGPHVPAGPRLFHGADMRRWLDHVGLAVGFPKATLRGRTFRVTYATARSQTVEDGAPVALWTVMHEMGHTSIRMLEKVYNRAIRSRQRREHVEFRWEDHAAAVGHRLEAAMPSLPDNWLHVLRALPAKGQRPKAWQQASGVGVGSFYYARARLVERGLVVADERRGTFHRTANGDAALLRAQRGGVLAAEG